MPGSQRISGEAFAIERLRANPDLDYAALRREAADAGVSMQPIQYGRARKQLGLPPIQKPGPTMVTRPDDGDDGGDARGANDTDPADDALDADDDAEERGDDGAPDHDNDSDNGDDRSDAAAARPSGDGDIVAPKRKGSAAFDFLVQELRREPHIAYGVLRERCEAKGWKIAPIMYGRAKAVLGLVPVKPRGSAKKAASASSEPAAPRVLKQVESVAADRFNRQLENVRSLEQLVAVVKDLDGERRRLRALLERIVSMIDEALG